MTILAGRAVGDLVQALAARTPTPGGGAAAAAAAALGCAAGAMAARYTTGAKWADRSDEAQALASRLEAAAGRILALADDDEAAFAAAQAARKAGDAAAATAADIRAAAVPAEVINLCAEMAEALAGFLPRCNPQLVSDVRVGVHLLAGAARAAWATAAANRPAAEAEAAAAAALRRVALAAETAG
jgi:formiminotetrahydrofolate cyclodeaminase